ncbi:Fe-S cluster assembly ATPase SufC [Candidatus Palibaumannia cicadellinicola]|uniref:FeS assembly ATPase SufC n=1 Tax=Baumannia cicadellinicola subsp. Homalodisca coagulata TaxID=374463 RepID=Q1LT12_BAUCH|nr:Fe-S cluster assembly ATPase SufC [Candidatus Baumannia cicadellinicola]ABF14316.1 FeS assembly ATPase SufC [Baumannia cicadellinicola str. Hc (Homalodisca coagulata)]MCJ7462060.1 Fe-S cluster assembly ATPase SufC [Candidatus Baumannia cicadellinicola]MCJ7463087.1 Fe-S cluster assembly ATPase SufC [Candidatus Baumannia cicadellinicola]
MLSIQNLNVEVENKLIINRLNLEIKPGEIHAIMGPNGSGKSTLSTTLAGHKDYHVTAGTIRFKEHNLLMLNPEERAGEGLFLAFQYPVEIPGISNTLFLQTAINSIRKYRKLEPLDSWDLIDLINQKINRLNISDKLLKRSVNVGFSGGEKKRNEILQMAVLEPDLCILDEIDSGLDIDALKIIARCITLLRNANRSFIVITHYQRILDDIQPEYVHVMHHGSIIKSGNFSLAKQLEEQGYDWLIK